MANAGWEEDNPIRTDDLGDDMDQEAESLRSMLLCLLIDNVEMDVEDAYALVYRGGKRILWH